MQYGIHIRVGLTIFLVMEGFELETDFVNPRTSLLEAQGIVQLGVKGQHVELHLLAIHHLDRVHHILNELGVTGSGWVNPHHHLRLLGFLLVGTFGFHQFSIGIDGFLALLVGFDYGQRKQFEQPRSETLTTGWVALDDH